jgi:hypothetical protein
MQDQKLREALEELHLKLLQLKTTDSAAREKADALAASIREALDSEDLGEYHTSLEGLLDEGVRSFEEAHPKLTGFINEILTLLGSIGI